MEFEYEIVNLDTENNSKGIGGLAKLAKLLPDDLFMVLSNYGGNEYFKLDLEYEGTSYKIRNIE